MKKFLPLTLSRYFMLHYFYNFLIILFGLLSIIYLFDTVELLRRVADKDFIPLTIVLQMSLLKLPEVGQLILPFGILFSAMMSFWQLTKRHELVIVRSAGLSVWQFIMPILIVAFTIGILKVSMINPLSAVMVNKYNQLEAKYLESAGSVVSFSDQGLWLRQNHEEGMAILHAEKIEMPDWKLQNVQVFFFSPQYDFLRRIDAQSAHLKSGEWQFNQAVINMPDAKPAPYDLLTLATDLTVGELEKSFSSPQSIAFWKLPSYIKTMEETGFDTRALHIYFQGLLAEPLLYLAMVILAACVSLRSSRQQGTAVLIMMGVGIGFVVFFSSSFLQALGASGQVPVIVAAWFPAVISFLLGVSALMVLEDG